MKSETCRTMLVCSLILSCILGATAIAGDAPAIIYIAQTNGLWISTDGGQSFGLTPGLADTSVRVVAVSNGVIYVGFLTGMARSADLGETFVTTESSGGISAFSFHNSLVYIGAGSRYVAVSEDDGNTFRKLGKVASWIPFLHFHEDTMFVGTSKGLSISTDNGKTFVTRTTQDGLAADLVYCMAEDAGTLYFGTIDGLSISTDGGMTFTNRSTEHGLFSNRINSICLKDGLLYLGTQSGLSISRDGGLTFETKRKEQGIPGNVIISLHVFDGSIYILANEGLCVTHDGGETFVILAAEGLVKTGSGSFAME